MRPFSLLIIFAVLCGPLQTAKTAQAAEPSRDVMSRDVVIYGGTSAAAVAAVRAAMLGASVVVVSPDQHLGGLSSGGLGYTDSGNTRAIGGLSRDFYRRIRTHYQSPEAWKWQPRESFAGLGQGVKKTDVADNTMWLFEPHVAERVIAAACALDYPRDRLDVQVLDDSTDDSLARTRAMAPSSCPWGQTTQNRSRATSCASISSSGKGSASSAASNAPACNCASSRAVWSSRR
jgi:hypothetical protein